MKNAIYDGVFVPNLANIAEQYGIGQYRFALNFELCGQTFELKAADKAYSIEFVDCKKAKVDGAEVAWECEKLEKDLYFVRLGAGCAALWLEENKAVVCPPDAAPVCCAIGDGAAPEPAGDAMVDTQSRWVFGANRYVDQIYTAPGKAKTTWSRYTVHMGKGARGFRDFWQPKEEDYVEEDVNAVFIGKGFYLVDAPAPVIPEGSVAPADMKRLVLLQDYERTMTVGCAFTSGDPIMLAGYGQFLDR